MPLSSLLASDALAAAPAVPPPASMRKAPVISAQLSPERAPVGEDGSHAARREGVIEATGTQDSVGHGGGEALGTYSPASHPDRLGADAMTEAATPVRPRAFFGAIPDRQTTATFPNFRDRKIGP